MEDGKQISWSEVRHAGEGQSELFFMVAEQTQVGWTFHERSTWEVRWYPVSPSEELVTKVKAEMGRRLQQ